MRSIYCDLSRLLQNGKMLSNEETKRHWSKHGTFINETIIQSNTKCAVQNRVDCRRFLCKSSSTNLFLIYVGTIFDPLCPVNIEWLRQITQGNPIDLVVMSCAYPDLSDRQLEKENEQFEKKFELFKSKFSIICSIFKLAFFESIMIWIPPLPSISLNDKQTKNLEKLIQICFDIACQQYNFQCLKSHYNWIKNYKQLFVENQFYISNQGVRQLTREISELMANKWHIQFSIESPNKRFKADHLS